MKDKVKDSIRNICDKLYIDMNKDCESLNASIAASIIMYELKLDMICRCIGTHGLKGEIKILSNFIERFSICSKHIIYIDSNLIKFLLIEYIKL